MRKEEERKMFGYRLSGKYGGWQGQSQVEGDQKYPKPRRNTTNNKQAPDLGMELYDVKKMKLAIQRMRSSSRLTEKQTEKIFSELQKQETFAFKREQERLAKLREELESEEREIRKFKRRDILQYGVLVGFLAGIGYGVNKNQQTSPLLQKVNEGVESGGEILNRQGASVRENVKKIYDDNFSAESFQRREEERQAREKENRLAYEKSRALNLDPTATSQSGWRMRRIPHEEGVSYQEVDPLESINLKEGDQIVFVEKKLGTEVPGPFFKDYTFISIDKYENVNGDVVPKFVVTTNSSIFQREPDTEEYFLTDNAGEEVEPEIIAMDKMKRDEARDEIVAEETKLINVSEMKIKPGYWKVRFMKKTAA